MPFRVIYVHGKGKGEHYHKEDKTMTKREMIERSWERFEELSTQYDEAEKAKDEKGMKEAREGYQKLLAEVRAEGKEFGNMMRLYSEMKRQGNTRIDLDGTYRDPPRIIKTLREFEVREFTFSSTWSNASETAWAFIQNGCKLLGMTEINSKYQKFMSDEYEKAPAFLFAL